jgi:hypothetical protein
MDQAQPIPTKGSSEYVDYVISLAKGPTLEQGVINEPRLYYDIITTPADQAAQTNGTPDVVFNRELFPVRLTHLSANVAWGFGNENIPTLLQQVALQLRYHDQFYMNPNPVVVPAWANKVVAAPDVNSSAMSAWDFTTSAGRPPILAKQDTFQVDVRCDDPTNQFIGADNPLPVTVSFTGFGLLTKRPYFFSGTVTLVAQQNIVSIPAGNFRNDGNEPIVITDMTVLCGGQADLRQQVFIPGDIRRISVNVRQVGSGTGSWWFAGPPNNRVCPASLLGLTTGRAVVHQFPGMGQLFGPGDGITLTVQRVGVSVPFQVPLAVGVAGYIMVT